MTKIINIITTSRIIVAPVIFIFLIFDNYFLSIILLFFAGFSDFFDGYLARKYNAESEIGAILDPIADKILIVFLILGIAIELNSSLVSFMGSIIISREIFISALRDFNARNNITGATDVTFLAKVKTSIQIFTLLMYLVALAFNNMFIIIIADIMLIISTIITIYTGYTYGLVSFSKYKES
tara:strand:+ start:333 stop:878 length:546 start_codon:yes stop_codon:yes gene_type:complete